MKSEILIDLVLFVLAVLWWWWFARRMDGIHAEAKRTADAVEAINTREMRADAKARAAEMARLEALQFEEDGDKA